MFKHVVGLALLSCVLPCYAQMKIVTTGDSITVGYGQDVMRNKLSELGFDQWTVQMVATPGCDNLRYTGVAIDPYAVPQAAHNYADDVLALDPDMVVLMLGTNDTFWNHVDTYMQNMPAVYAKFSQAAGNPRVVLCTVLPMIENPSTVPNSAQANIEMVERLNPWIRQQADAYGFILLDVWSLIQQEDEWQSLYKPDGIHLTAEGYDWLAEQAASGIPEPGTLVLVSTGSLFIVKRPRRRHRAQRD